MSSKLPPLWQCPKCGERFVTRNMWHSCGKYKLEALFARSEPHVFPLFQKFAAVVRACGPVTMIPQKSRIVFMVRVRFAGCTVKKSHLDCGFLLTRRLDHPRIHEVITFSPRSFGHRARVRSEKDLDARLKRWIREAYAYGQQKHLEKRAGRGKAG